MLDFLMASAFVPLDRHMTGEILFEKIISFFRENQLGLERINMLVTDGAPAIVGQDTGTVR